MTARGRRETQVIKKMGRLGGGVHWARNLARFAVSFGAFFPYVSLAWPTSDHIIPAALVNVMTEQIPMVQALGRVNAARAAGLGMGLLSTEQVPEVEADFALAYPQDGSIG